MQHKILRVQIARQGYFNQTQGTETPRVIRQVYVQTASIRQPHLLQLMIENVPTRCARVQTVLLRRVCIAQFTTRRTVRRVTPDTHFLPMHVAKPTHARPEREQVAPPVLLSHPGQQPIIVHRAMQGIVLVVPDVQKLTRVLLDLTRTVPVANQLQIEPQTTTAPRATPVTKSKTARLHAVKYTHVLLDLELHVQAAHQ